MMMAEVRCPMCGKSNPADIDVCQFCQARIKPLIAGTDDSPAEQEPQEEWWQALGSQSDDKRDDVGDEIESSDWLGEIFERGELSGEVEDPDIQESEDDSDDWLRRIRADEDDIAPVEERVATDDEADWMSNLTADSDEEDEITSEESKAPDLPDWLDSSQEEELPDWLATGVTDEKTSQDDIAEPLDVSSNQNLEMTPADQDEDRAEQAVEEDAVPDWLVSRDEELPDWLSGRETEPPAPTGQEADLESNGSAEWSAQPEAGIDEEPDVFEVDRVEIPVWLTEMTSEAQSDADAVSDEPEIETPITPDWLAEIDEDAASGLPTDIEPGLEEVFTRELPDETPPSQTVGDQPDAGPLPDWLDDFGSDEPDWLETIDDQPSDSLSEEGAAEDLDWLSSIEAPADFLAVEGEIVIEEADSDFSEGLPGWVADEGADEVELVEGSVEPSSLLEQADDALIPADLPGWLEAMRPVEALEAAGLPDEAAPVEGAGPLSGLKGVLPAEPDISYVRKPAAYSLKLRVNDVQQQNAALLKHLVEIEGEAEPVATRPVVTSQYILRVLIFVVLVLTISLSLIAGFPQVPVPIANSEVLEVSQLISRITPGLPVLVAMDYEPGWSGELDVITGLVLDDLMRRGAYLTFVSTVPTGPIQIERLVAMLNETGDYQYAAPAMYANLGFIPGGIAGVQNFVANPRQAIGAALSDWSGDTPVWQSPQLASVNTLLDFKLLLVASENPDTVRMWIEQSQPVQTGVLPLVVLTSEQAAPMVRPYYAATPRQVSGFLSGLEKGVVYEGLLGHSADGKANRYLSPFSISIFIVVVLITVGAGLNAITLLLARRKEEAEDRE